MGCGTQENLTIHLLYGDRINEYRSLRQRMDDVRSRRALSARFFLYGVDQLLDSDQHQRTAVSLRQAVLRNGILKFSLFFLSLEKGCNGAIFTR